MLDPELSSRMALIVAIGLVASLVAWGWLARKWAQSGTVLELEPRQPVPWMLGGTLPAILMTFAAFFMALAPPGQPASPTTSADDFTSRIFSLCVTNLFFAVVIVAVLVMLLGATWRDLGWPVSMRQLLGDIGMGIGLASASLIPIYLIQAAAAHLLGIPPTHPLLESMQENREPMVFLAAILAAVVVAPILEELLFRLLLQGGLERWEDQILGLGPHQPQQEETSPLPMESDRSPERWIGAADDSLHEVSLPAGAHFQAPATVGAVLGLRHGWAPILASSFLFALAHLGHGPSPISLFVFALFLGYAYQRTHRIVPSIVAHLMLNLYSMTTMILLLLPKSG